jgi:transcriptional regulator with XRE-family HTH domain
MHEVPAHKPPTVRLRRLAKEMARLREAAGFATREAAAERVHMDASSLWRLETAKNRPLKRTVLVLLELYGVTNREDQARYLDLLAKSNELNWLTPYEESLSEDYQTYISFEADAARLTGAETAFVPGLLQIPEYARALIRGVHPSLQEDDIASRAEVRARRQEALAKKGTALWMVLDEAVLHHAVGGPDVMRAQLDRLLQEDSKRVVLQVVPFGVGAHPASMGSFILMEFPDPDPDLVYIETLTGNLFLEKPEEVALHRANLEHLIARAQSPAETRKMITARKKDYA